MIDLSRQKHPPLIMIKRAKVELQKEKPFFSDLIFYLKLIEAKKEEGWNIPSMGVDGKGNLYFNPEWVSTLTSEQIKSVLCFPKGAIVSGVNKFIEDVEVGDFVDGEGGLQKVVKLFERDYVGELIKIRGTNLLPVEATPEHPFYVGKIPERKSVNKENRSIKEQIKTAKFSWVKAKDITIGDVLVLPKPRAAVNTLNKVYIFRSKYAVKGKPVEIPVNKDTAWFFGLYVAEGSKCGRSIQFSLNIKEKHLANRIKLIAKKYFNSNSGELIVGNTLIISVHYLDLANACRGWFGENAKVKRVPQFIYDNTNEVVEGFLKGYMVGDGSTYKHNGLKVWSFATASKMLAIQLQALFMRFGILSSLYLYHREAGYHKIRGKVLPDLNNYQALIQGRKAEIFFNGKSNRKDRLDYFDDGDNIYVKVKELQVVVDYCGRVYNFETKNHTYCVQNILTHNCHEVIHLAFLHIPRGEKKREHFIWNLAIDCQANYIVEKNNMKLPDVCCKPDFYFGSVKIMNGTEIVYEVENVESKSAEKIYVELLDNLPRQNKGKGKGKGQGIGIEYDDEGNYKGGFDKHLDKVDSSAGSEGQELSKEDKQRLQQMWKDRLINSIYRAQSCGNTPAGMDRYIKDLLEPKIDWRTKLYKHISDELPNDFTFRKPHKRSSAIGHYCPSYTKEALRVGVFIDTSGSIGQDELKQFKSECVAIAKSFDSISMVLGYIDTQMYPPIEVENGNIQQIIDSTPKGGGGTDMRQVFKFIDEKCNDLEVVVILTDADSPMPKPEDLKSRKVLWVVPKRSEDYAKRQFDNKDIGEWVVIE